MFLQGPGQALLSLENAEVEERLQCVYRIIASVVQEAVFNLEAGQYDAQRLSVIELAPVLVQFLVVNNLQEIRHFVHVEVERVQVFDILFDVVANDDHTPWLP